MNILGISTYYHDSAGRPPLSRIVLLGLLAWVLVSTALGRTFTAIHNIGGDAALYAYIGEKWLQGYIPYVDIWDNKPPGIFFVDALVFSLAPKSFTALAVVEGFFTIGCITTVFAIMRRFGAPFIPVFLATSACAVMSNLEYFNSGGNITEMYILFPAALSMLFFARALPNLRIGQVLLAGFFAGIATSFKLIGLAPFFAQLAFLMLGYILGHWAFRSIVSAAIISIAGFALAWLPWLAYFSWHNSALELLGVSFVYPFLYAAGNQPHVTSVPFVLVERLRPVASLAVSAFVGIGLLAPRMYKMLSAPLSALEVKAPGKWVGGWAALSALWLFFDILGALAGGRGGIRGYEQYFLAISASLPVMAGISYWYAIERVALSPKKGDAVRVFVVCVILSSPVLTQALDVRALKHAGETIPKTDEITQYINSNKDNDSTLFTWPYKPQFYFKTGLLSPHKLTSSVNLRDSSYMRKVFANDLLTTLENESPTFIVDSAEPMRPDQLLFSLHARLQTLIHKRYALVNTERKLRLYRRRP